MSIRIITRTLLLGAALFAAGAVACSSDDGDDEPSGSTTTTTTTVATTIAPPATTSAAETTTSAAQTTAESTTGGAASSTVEVSLAEDDLGSYLVGPDGRTLYVFLQDAPDTSNCTGNCLEIWPPLLLEDGQSVEAGAGVDGEFGSIETPSGTQVTYDQVPLYYFVSDTAAGETKGHLVGNVWFVARPDTASTSVVVVRDDGSDPYLAGPNGLSLYLFANDTEGVSNCSGQCLVNWPALIVPEGLEPTAVSAAGGELATIARDDGALQVTYNGLPLYYFIGDKLPGDTTGDGVNNVWELAKP